jgi:predicted metal-dependent HD superfamily phosphohydrolase
MDARPSEKNGELEIAAIARARWLALCGRLGARASDAAESWWTRLATLHAEPARHYHTMTHVCNLLERIDDALAIDPSLPRDQLELDAFFHEYVVVAPTASDL